VDHQRYCDEVANQAGLLRQVVAGADLSVRVPTTPDWALADLLRHVGGNLRAIEQAVRTGEAVPEPERQVPGHGGPDGDDPAALDAWLAEAATACAATLGAAGPHRLEALPLKLEFCHTRLAAGEDAAWMRRRFRSACAALDTWVEEAADRLVISWR